VVDNEEAKIMVGKRDVYVSQTLSQAQTTTVTSESVQFVDVGVKLNVVPNISSDGFIIMKIKPEVSTVDSVLTTYLQSQIPIISTSEAETVVKVKDGTMIMIAGLMKEENIDDIKGWPYLSKVKALGAAFGNRSTQKKNTELIIFITPHIITGEAPVDDYTVEDLYPADVLPKPLKEDLIDEGISRIGAKKEKPLKNYISKREKASGAKSSAAVEDLMLNMKGSKKY
jgi:general secretion pathway protein D